MTAKIYNLEPSIYAALIDGSVTYFDIASADIELRDGRLRLKAKDLVAASHKPAKEAGASKTGAERARTFVAKKKSAGWKRDWIDPSTLELAASLGGIEKIIRERESLIRRLQEAEEKAATAESLLGHAESKLLEFRSKRATWRTHVFFWRKTKSHHPAKKSLTV